MKTIPLALVAIILMIQFFWIASIEQRLEPHCEMKLVYGQIPIVWQDGSHEPVTFWVNCKE